MGPSRTVLRFDNCALQHRAPTTSFRYPAAGRSRIRKNTNTQQITSFEKRSPVSGSNIHATGPLGLSYEPNKSPGRIIRRRSRRGRRCLQLRNLITAANSEGYPFVLYACLAITPANALLMTLISLTWRHFVGMVMTWSGHVSRRVMAWRSKRKGTRFTGLPRRELNKTGGGAWWRLDIGDFVPSEFPDSETFWLSVAVLIAWGIVARISTYVRKLRMRSEK